MLSNLLKNRSFRHDMWWALFIKNWCLHICKSFICLQLSTYCLVSSINASSPFILPIAINSCCNLRIEVVICWFGSLKGKNRYQHCKYSSRNISGFYACPILSCTILVLITTLGCAQLSDVMNLISCTLFVSIATNKC